MWTAPHPHALLTFFFRYMRPSSKTATSTPPCRRCSSSCAARRRVAPSRRKSATNTPAELRGDNPNAKVDISRFKGLGEMDAHELWETTIAPRERTLRRITLEDAILADEIFTVLMGEKVEPRKEFIEKNAQYAVNLDF